MEIYCRQIQARPGERKTGHRAIKINGMAWVYLLIASIFEVGWTFSLKFLDLRKTVHIQWRHVWGDRQNLVLLGSLTGYVLFGLGNIFFFSLAMKQIPASTALAAWMGAALVGVTLVDISVLKEPYQLSQFFFMGLILVGVWGLSANRHGN
jgi:quaternary ammonium compound-resistance protein SugE